MDHWTIGPLDHWTIECQISKVDKVKLLSERTSGVPPVIFYTIELEIILKNCFVGKTIIFIFKEDDICEIFRQG